ncbi:hypothetical protein ABIA39_008550 [Nocardia sp. GAS34]|uniref:hypothetical protein n=1 Tax=unclassified Nocardia TaxID=2637762 RepID=UPI003D1FCD31
MKTRVAKLQPGKTTIARVVVKIYCGIELLKTDKVVEAKRMDFVSQNLGGTAIKTERHGAQLGCGSVL